MKKLLVGLLLLLPSLAFGYQGVTGVWAMKKGDYTTRNFAGTRAGIQDAVNYCPYGGIIQVYVGRIVNDGTPIRIPYSGITLAGSGDSTVFAGSTVATDTTNIFEITGSRVTLKDFKIDGTKYARTSGKGNGIRIFGSSCKINNVMVANVPNYGILINDSTCVNTSIDNCRFTENGSIQSKYSIYSSGEATLVSNCYFYYNSGIYLGGKYSTAIGNRISSNNPVSAAINGINIAGLGSTAASNNISKMYNGINLDADSALITSNIISQGRNGMHSTGYGKGCTISNNTIYRSGVYGIFIEYGHYTDRLTIRDNTILSAGLVGIDMECGNSGDSPCDKIFILNNIVSVTPGSSSLVTPIRMLCPNNGSYRNLHISDNTLSNGYSWDLWFDTTSSTMDSTVVTNNKFLNFGTAPINFEAVVDTSRLYISDNYCLTPVGRIGVTTPGGKWKTERVGYVTSRKSVGVFDDSLRVGNANSPASLVVSGDAYVYGTLTAGTLNYSLVDTSDVDLLHSLRVGDSLNVAKTSVFVQGFGSSGNSWVSSKFTVGDSLRSLGPAKFDAGTFTTGNSWFADNLTIGDTLNASYIKPSSPLTILGNQVINDSLRINKGIRTAKDIDIDAPGNYIRFTGATTPSIYTTTPAVPLALGAMGDSQVVAIGNSSLYTEGYIWARDSLVAGGGIRFGPSTAPTVMKLQSYNATVNADTTLFEIIGNSSAASTPSSVLQFTRGSAPKMALAVGGNSSANNYILGATSTLLRFGYFSDTRAGTVITATLNPQTGALRVGGLTSVPSHALDVDGNAYIADSLRVNNGLYLGGAKVNKIMRGSNTLDFDLSGASACQELGITVDGAAVGDEVMVGVPDSAITGLGVIWSAWVSATNTVTIRMCRVCDSTPNPALGTYTATVIH